MHTNQTTTENGTEPFEVAHWKNSKNSHHAKHDDFKKPDSKHLFPISIGDLISLENWLTMAQADLFE